MNLEQMSGKYLQVKQLFQFKKKKLCWENREKNFRNRYDKHPIHQCSCTDGQREASQSHCEVDA